MWLFWGLRLHVKSRFDSVWAYLGRLGCMRQVHNIPATLHVVASVRALVLHSVPLARYSTTLSRTYVKRAVHATGRPFGDASS
eukprot:2216965-Prymnesium_polylepis.1